MSRQSWQSAIGEIPVLLEGEPSRDNALLLAALYALQTHIMAQVAVDGHQVALSAIEPQNASQGFSVEDVEDELGDAEKYLKRYADTMDADYLQMSFDETTHSLKFIKAMPDGEAKRGYMARHDQIVERIKAYGMAI